MTTYSPARMISPLEAAALNCGFNAVTLKLLTAVFPELTPTALIANVPAVCRAGTIIVPTALPLLSVMIAESGSNSRLPI